MSLPQQPKKTPEEIAKLRESMGIIVEAPPGEELVLETPSADIDVSPPTLEHQRTHEASAQGSKIYQEEWLCCVS